MKGDDMRLTDGQRKALERVAGGVSEEHLIIIKVEYGGSWVEPGVHVRRESGWDVRAGVYHVEGYYQFGGHISTFQDRNGAIRRAQDVARWLVSELGVAAGKIKIRAQR